MSKIKIITNKKKVKKSLRRARSVHKLGTTADLVVRHAEKHIEREANPHRGIFAPIAFMLSGALVVLVAMNLMQSVQLPTEFVAEDAQDYVAQEQFYKGEELVAEDDSSDISEELHAAAGVNNASEIITAFGLLLILVAVWYMHHEHHMFNPNRPKFVIRRIR